MATHSFPPKSVISIAVSSCAQFCFYHSVTRYLPHNCSQNLEEKGSFTTLKKNQDKIGFEMVSVDTANLLIKFKSTDQYIDVENWHCWHITGVIGTLRFVSLINDQGWKSNEILLPEDFGDSRRVFGSKASNSKFQSKTLRRFVPREFIFKIYSLVLQFQTYTIFF